MRSFDTSCVLHASKSTVFFIPPLCFILIMRNLVLSWFQHWNRPMALGPSLTPLQSLHVCQALSPVHFQFLHLIQQGSSYLCSNSPGFSGLDQACSVLPLA